MNILIIKMSSLGDTIHTLPAITDIKNNYPNCTITWLIEPGFQEVPSWHAAVDNIITLSLRKLKKNPYSLAEYTNIITSIKKLRENTYDIIIDAQGLLKSALIAKIAKGKSAGYDKNSIKEKIASRLYTNTFKVSKNIHAVERIRSLCALSLAYNVSNSAAYNINNSKNKKNYIIIFHGTTWDNKHYQIENWQSLIQLITAEGYQVLLPWASELEKQRAIELGKNKNTKVLDKMNLSEIKEIIANAKGAIGLDTGLSHLAAATDTPCVAIYGPTNPNLSRNYGAKQTQIKSNATCAPCMKRSCVKTHVSMQHPCMQNIAATEVWEKLKQLWTN